MKNFMVKKNANYGFNPELEKQQQSPEDWIFGSSSKSCIALIPEKNRRDYLPTGETQKGIEDMMDCASRGPLNILEAKFLWLLEYDLLRKENTRWLEDNYVKNNRIEFSDAFVAINSGTTRQGNSLKAPLDAIRKQGLIPKSVLRLEPWMTWDDYHNSNRITPAMKKLGEDFVTRFTINYEKVLESDYATLLGQDMLDVAGYAWPEPVNGEYPRTDLPPNHVFVAFQNPKYNIFDNYIDSVDGDFIKKLASDYSLLSYGYRLIISENELNPIPVKKSFFSFWEKWFPSPYKLNNCPV